MGVKTFVLGSDRSVQDIFADLIDLDRFAILELELSQNGLAVRSIHGRCSRGAKRLRIGVVGKVLKPSVGKRRSADEKGDENCSYDRQDRKDNGLAVLLPDIVTTFDRSRAHLYLQFMVLQHCIICAVFAETEGGAITRLVHIFRICGLGSQAH